MRALRLLPAGDVFGIDPVTGACAQNAVQTQGAWASGSPRVVDWMERGLSVVGVPQKCWCENLGLARIPTAPVGTLRPSPSKSSTLSQPRLSGCCPSRRITSLTSRPSRSPHRSSLGAMRVCQCRGRRPLRWDRRGHRATSTYVARVAGSRGCERTRSGVCRIDRSGSVLRLAVAATGRELRHQPRAEGLDSANPRRPPRLERRGIPTPLGTECPRPRP